MSYPADVLSVFETCDPYDGLFWRVEGDTIRFFAICNDLFWWGTADAEEIEPGDIPLLRKCAADLIAIDNEFLLSDLFAARKRGMRPQSAYYGTTRVAGDERLRALFDEAGPARDDEMSILNPGRRDNG